MFYRSCPVVIFALVLALTAASRQQAPNNPTSSPAIPDTPAGHTFKAWFDSFNSGERALIEAYIHKYDPDKSVDREMQFRSMTGGFVLLQIMKSEPLRLEFLVKERVSETRAIGKFDVKPGDPAMVASFGLRAIPPGTSVADLNSKIDAATRARVIDGAIANLNESYVFPETAKKMEEAVRARQKKGAYDSITDGDDFARMLT